MVEIELAQQRKFAVEVVEKLRAAGFLAYWAGGCVRDQLLGRLPKDYDVATSARPVEIRELFGRRRTLPIGAAFGVITVLGPKGGGQIEVATFRHDAAYSDGRHPDAVTFSTPHDDAQRRDFTINGLFYDPHEQRVIDFVDGQQDLERQLVRAIGDARARFREDKLRLLRAVRFAARLGFELETTTREAIIEMASEIHVVSVERIAAELRSILTHAGRRRGLELLRELGLLAAILPVVAPHAADGSSPGWQRALERLERLSEPSFPLALAGLLLGLVPPEGVEQLGRQLKLSNAEIKRSTWLVANAPALEQAEELPWPRLQRLLIAEPATELLALAAADAEASGHEPAALDYCRRMLALPPEQLNPPPLVSGEDLIAHGVRPGPGFQRLLERVRDAQLEGTITSPAAALRLVEELRAGDVE